jgi:predicted amidohydrolase YtcJ
MRAGLCWSAVLLLAFSSTMRARDRDSSEAPADQIFINGVVYTGLETQAFVNEARKRAKILIVPASKRILRVQAIAVRGDRVVSVASNGSVERFKGSKTKVIDLEGKFVMPGFNDAHLHLASGGFEKLNVSFAGVKSLEEMKARIAERAKSAAPGEWLQGRGWDHTLWPGQQLPTRQDLDAVTGDHPAIFGRVDGHISVANTAALKQGGITRATPDRAGGKIDRDQNGEPTGILRETAMGAVYDRIPPPTPAQRRKAAELALAEAAQWGLTSAQDNSDWQDFLVYEELEREGKLTLRITEWLPFDAPLELLEQHRAHHPATDSMLHTGMLKGFMDGSLGSRTAALLAPYADDPKNAGLPRYDQAKLNEMARERAAAGFQLGFHAIGDQGAEMALQAFAEAQNYVKQRGSGQSRQFRFRIEHAQVIGPAQFARFHELGVIASMQPNHLLTDMNWAESRIGAQRGKTSYAWAQFVANDVPLAFGTDYPVEPITPFRGIYAAITRKNEAGNKEYFPEQKLSIDDALTAYTVGAAYAEFAEHDKGGLAPGKLADFIVLDRDLTKVSPAEILKTKVLRTVVGGKTVYQAK